MNFSSFDDSDYSPYFDARSRASTALDQMNSEGMAAPLLSGFSTNDASNSFASSMASGMESEARMANAGLSAKAQLIDAGNQRDYYRDMAKIQNEANRAAKRKSSGIGGIFGALGTAASFIPGAGPLIGAGLKAAGGFIG